MELYYTSCEGVDRMLGFRMVEIVAMMALVKAMLIPEIPRVMVLSYLSFWSEKWGGFCTRRL